MVVEAQNDKTSIVITNLIPTVEYEFHVVALITVGLNTPSVEGPPSALKTDLRPMITGIAQLTQMGSTFVGWGYY
jgi:hypothetical protein